MNSILNALIAIAALFASLTDPAYAATGVVPEPGTLALTGIGLGLVVYFVHKNRKK